MTYEQDISLFERMIMYFHRALEAFAESLRYRALARIAFDAGSFYMGHAGECADKISKDFRGEVEEINWKKLIRTRHIIFHDYHRIDPTEIQVIFSEKLPNLLKHFEEILRKKKGEV